MMQAAQTRRRWLAPEVVQTSSMDCGPAALKCLLEGYGVAASYGRLREACQTSIDGTSIEAIEAAAVQLGLEAEQVMLPLDHLFLEEAGALPAIAVTRQSDGAAHFCVVWRRHGRWLQVMDPACGRRWVNCRRFGEELAIHRMPVAAQDWHEWAMSPDFLMPLARRLQLIGADAKTCSRLIDGARAGEDWRPLAALDAATRMVTSLISAGALRAGASASALAETMAERVMATNPAESPQIPPVYWSVRPIGEVAEPVDGNQEQLLLRGVVLVRVRSKYDRSVSATNTEAIADLSPELRAALDEPPPRPFRELMRLLASEGVVTPLVLAGAIVLAVTGVLVETFLLRGLLDVARELELAGQRAALLGSVLLFMVLLLTLEFPIASVSLRLGRHLESRCRRALSAKLPLLEGRYLQSRPVSDMAERAHSIVLIRTVPELAARLAKALLELTLTALGIVLIAPGSFVATLGMVGLALLPPLAFQPLLHERDARVRAHAGALFGFYLDALLGLVAVRVHGGERAVQREYEIRLVEWLRSSRGLVAMTSTAEALQAFSCLSCGGWLLCDYLQHSGPTGNTLLLVYWTLKVPAIGKQLSAIARQYPGERNALLRLLEPIMAPAAAGDEPDTEAVPPAATTSPQASEPVDGGGGTRICIRQGHVVAGGHTLLENIDLEIEPGEHIAIVGASGAGKSSLLGLMLGWHRLAEGTIEIDDNPLSPSRLRNIRRCTVWVDPGVQLWNRSLWNNLIFSSDGQPISNIGQVVASADLAELIDRLQHGFQSSLGEGGCLVSGGEGHRIRFGRGLMQTGVRLALLDEPFRGLDRDQRRKLLARARARWRHATLLCVTHDIEETLEFDRVLVVDGGRIVEDGVPVDLAACSSRYREFLLAGNLVREELWGADYWRRLWLKQGRIARSPILIQGVRHRSAPPRHRAAAYGRSDSRPHFPTQIEIECGIPAFVLPQDYQGPQA